MEFIDYITAFRQWYDAIRPVFLEEARQLREREEAMAFYRLKRMRKTRYRKQHDLLSMIERNEISD